jgi:hypothetical protein
MSQQAAAVLESLESAESIEKHIGPEAAAILEFTSNIGEEKSPHELTYITSKQAYVWAGIAVELAHDHIRAVQEGDARRNMHDDIRVKGRLFAAMHLVEDSYSTVNDIPQLSEPEEGLSNPVNYKPFPAANPEAEIGNIIFRYSCGNIIVPSQGGIERVNEHILQGYNRCRELGLISDPVIEVGLGIAILGFVPFNIQKRTKAGHVVYRKIQAGLWKYEQERRRDGATKTSLTFAAARIARAFKTGLIAAYHDATKGEGDEVAR